MTADVIPHLVMKNDRTLEFVESEVVEGPRKQDILRIIQFPITIQHKLARGYADFAEAQKEETFYLCLLWAGALVAFLSLAVSITKLRKQFPQ